MYVSQNQAYSAQIAVKQLGGTSSTAVTGAATGYRNGAGDGNVSLSAEAQAASNSNAVYRMNTGSGDREIDLATYFEPKQQQGDLFSIDDLLLPSSENVQALQDHLAKIFPDFLSRHNIPEAPSSISYDTVGKIVLPADYPYADQLKQALQEEPAIARELSTTNALASHLAALKQLEPYHQEMDKAQTQAEIDAVIDRYSHLLHDNASYPEVSLSFTNEGRMTVMADGAALV